MFSSIGSLELLVIAIIALLVVGPERLPAAVRTGSLWIGRFRRNFYKIKAEIERELNADEIKRQLHNESVMADLNEAKKQVTDFTKETEKSVQETLDLEEAKSEKPTDSGATDDLKKIPSPKQQEGTTIATPEVKPAEKKFQKNIKKDLSWKNGETPASLDSDSPTPTNNADSKKSSPDNYAD